MFNFTGVLLDSFQSTGHLGTGGGTTLEGKIMIIIIFVAGMFTHYAYTKIKEFIKKNIEENEKDNKKSDDERE